LGRSFKDEELVNITKLKKEEFENIIKEKFNESRNKRNKLLTDDANIELEKRIFIQTIDFLWRSHLQYLEHLRQVVGLRSYAHKDPLDEFKREAFKLFEDLLNEIKVDIILPNYNSDSFLHETIDSVLNQTFKNWRLIIVDDNSNLNNKELLKIHKAKKDISQDTSGPKNVSNNLFVGSTAELQRFLKKGKDIKENEEEI